MPSDDPEWVKGVVAKALLHATNKDTGIGATPAVRVSGDWPSMQTTVPDFAPVELPTEAPQPSAPASGANGRSVTDGARELLTPPPIQTSAPSSATQQPAPPQTAPEPVRAAPTAHTAAAAPAAQHPAPPQTAPEPARAAPAAEAAATEDLRPMEVRQSLIQDGPAPSPVSTEPETTYMAPSESTRQVQRAIVDREQGGLAPNGQPDRRNASVAVAKPSRGTDDQLMEEADATMEGYRTSDLRTILEWLAVIVAALAVALLIKAFVLQAFWIPSVSMETTVNKGDRILVNKVSYKLHEVRRGDLVVFKKLPGSAGTTEDLIKRAIALPGETIEVRDDGRLWIWGPGETPEDAKRLEEPYLTPNNAFIPVPSSPNDQGAFGNANCVNGESPTRCTLDDASYFMMGDNRTQSADSRSFGPVPEENIVGRAFLRIWPPSDIDTL